MKKTKRLKQKVIRTILAPLFLIYIISIIYLSFNFYNQSISQTKKYAKTRVEEFSALMTSNLQQDIVITRTLSGVLETLTNEPPETRLARSREIALKTAKNNPEYLSVWFSWQLFTLDDSWEKDYGRVRLNVITKPNTFVLRDTLDLAGEAKEGLYHQIHEANMETITSPYYEDYEGTYSDSILATSICVPLNREGIFTGLVGIDLDLSFFQSLIEEYNGDNEEQIVLFSSDGRIIASSDKALQGSFLKKKFPEIFNEFNLFAELKKQNIIETEISTNESINYYTISAIQPTKWQSDWGLAVITPRESIISQGKKSMITTIIIGLIGLTVITALLMSMVFNIVSPIGKIAIFAKNIENGDLNATLEIERDDEMGQMVKALRSMALRIKEIIASIHANAATVDIAAEHINNHLLQLTERTNLQASSMEEVSTSMNEILHSTRSNSDHANSTGKISSHSNIELANSAQVFSMAEESIINLNEKIMMIRDIAFQTNILALNAAVEAARAGEYGKGFSVVAGEVRKLAEQSSNTSEIMEQLAGKSKTSVEEVSQKLSLLIPKIKKTSELVHEIILNSEEQNSAVQQITSAIDQLNDSIQNTARESDEMTQYLEQLKNKSEELRQSTKAFFANY
ncbi:methyl-accepting chemotaxis protein [Marinilabilia sp.]|uniref:methyl-accepting chemotaxis protein n=1 Tax=Marinilabilia sp. TaxID=2021252 RepID=UPI0025BDEFB6|nr:methyl-accepting chemotaxis protein [Marinilabilia sp.]